MKSKQLIDDALLKSPKTVVAHDDEGDLMDEEIDLDRPANELREWYGTPVDWDWDE